MLANQLTTLLADETTGVTDALKLVSDVDAILVTGLARPDADREVTLAALTAAFTATPLGDRVAESIEKINAGSLADEHVVALAAARAALLGAVHDALISAMDGAIGRARAVSPPPAVTEGGAATAALRGAARSWLAELAVTGLLGVDEASLSGANQIIEGLFAEPEGRRLAVLLDGFTAELHGCAPIAAMEEIPARRWADMWTRAELLARDNIPTTENEVLSGRLLILGVELFEHPTMFGAQVHGVCEPADGSAARLVRITVTAPKVDTIVGPAMWVLLADHPNLLAALAQGRAVKLTDATVTPLGDLAWNDVAVSLGEEVDPIAAARMCLSEVVAPAASPADRHPVAIAEPVFIESYKAVKGEPARFDLGGAVLDLDIAHLPTAGPMTAKHVTASTACVGLLRWDAGTWRLRPLAVLTPVKRQPTVIHNGEWAAGPTDPKVAKALERNDSVRVLRERAGRLLRT